MGLAKTEEIIIAKILKHNVVANKRMPDACSKDGNLYYEYLSCYEGGSGQLDRVFKHPPDKREQSLKRITRNAKIYIAFFFKHSLDVKIIYEIEPDVLLRATEKLLDNSSNDISHVGFDETWAKTNGEVVYTANKKSK